MRRSSEIIASMSGPSPVDIIDSYFRFNETPANKKIETRMIGKCMTGVDCNTKRSLRCYILLHVPKRSLIETICIFYEHSTAHEQKLYNVFPIQLHYSPYYYVSPTSE